MNDSLVEVTTQISIYTQLAAGVFSIYGLGISIPEKDIILKQYNLGELSIIKLNDMMTRYYYGKINDIFRIERFCKTSGISIVYRRVAN